MNDGADDMLLGPEPEPERWQGMTPPAPFQHWLRQRALTVVSVAAAEALDRVVDTEVRLRRALRALRLQEVPGSDLDAVLLDGGAATVRAAQTTDDEELSLLAELEAAKARIAELEGIVKAYQKKYGRRAG